MNTIPPQHISFKPIKPRVMREIPPEWDEIMRLATQIPFGELVIKIQNGKVHCTEYKVLRKPCDVDNFEIVAL